MGSKEGFLQGEQGKIKGANAFTFTKNPVSIIMMIQNDKVKLLEKMSLNIT